MMATSIQVVKVLNKENLHQVCRCCLSQDIVTNIFELAHDTEMFVDIFSRLLSTSVKDFDDMPKNICGACLKEIIRFYNFKNNVTKVERSLLTLLEEQTVKPICNSITNDVHNETEQEFRKIEDSKQYKLDEKVDCEQELHKELHKTDTIEENIDVKNNDLQECTQASTEPNSSSSSQSKEKSKKKRRKNASEKANSPERTFTCYHCQQIFTSRGLFYKHRRELQHFGPALYPCNICGKKFTKKSGLNAHSYTHTKEKMFECKICDKKFSLPSTLGRHMQAHRGKRLFCEFCGRGFNRVQQLEEHRSLHTGEYRYLCPHCGKGYSTLSKYRIHVKFYEEHKFCEPNTLTCNICDETLSTKNALTFHLKKHGKKQFLCSDCGESFHFKLALEKHNCQRERLRKLYKSKIHKLQCLDCQMEFPRADHYSWHMEKVHGEGKTEIDDSKELNFMCEVCKKFYSTRQILEDHCLMHLMAEQSGRRIKNYACNKCEKAFTNKCELKLHENRHIGYKPFVCEVCSKAFYTKTYLNGHMRTHTGERPYRCNYCDKTFPLSQTLMGHLRRHTGEKHLFQCEHCQQKFSHPSTLYSHRKKQHGKLIK